MAREVLRVVVDKQGRTFERGEKLPGRPGVKVREIIKVGSYVTVRLDGKSVRVPDVPLHVDDLDVWS